MMTKPMTPIEALRAANAAAEQDSLDREYDNVMQEGDWEAVAIAELRKLGFVIVPTVPTKAMVDASADQYDFGDGDLAEIQARVRIEEDINTYRAMIEAPQAESEASDG